MHANDFLVSRLCCVVENGNPFNYIEAGYEKSSCYVYFDENNASLIETEAGFIYGMLSTL